MENSLKIWKKDQHIASTHLGHDATIGHSYFFDLATELVNVVNLIVPIIWNVKHGNTPFSHKSLIFWIQLAGLTNSLPTTVD